MTESLNRSPSPMVTLRPYCRRDPGRIIPLRLHDRTELTKTGLLLRL